MMGQHEEYINRGSVNFGSYHFQNPVNEEYNKTGDSIPYQQMPNTNGTLDPSNPYMNQQIGPDFFHQDRREDHDMQDQDNIVYNQSGIENVSQSEISRKTFQRVNLLGKNGSRKNFTLNKAPGEDGIVGQIENFGLGTWSPDVMNKILYSLLQQIELVKYMISEDKEEKRNKFKEAGLKIIDTIMKALNSSAQSQSVFNNTSGKKIGMQRTRIHSIEIESVRDIFVMVNNFALFFIRNNMNWQGFVLLQCAVQITKNYADILEHPGLLSTLYNNLSIYHARGRGKLSESQSYKYIDGAILAQLKQKRLMSSAQIDITLAITLNNKAVMELKRKNPSAAKENSIKAIDLMEPKLFGMINSGLITTPQRNAPQSEVNSHFQRILEVLLIAYFNFAQTQDQSLEARDIYLKGLQLCFQYHREGQLAMMFKRFYVKYTRKHYQIMLIHKHLSQQRNDLDTTQRLPVPEIMPLECIYEDSKEINESLNNDFYQKFIHSLQQSNNQAQQQNFGEGVSFTVMDSSRTRVTHMQNQHETKLLLPKINESVVSMPPMPMTIHYAHPKQEETQQKPKTQMSEMVNYDHYPKQFNMQSHQADSRMNEQLQQHQQLQVRQQNTQAPPVMNQTHNLNLEYKESNYSREMPPQGVMNMNTPPKRGKEDIYSIHSSNLGATAKFGGVSETHSRKQTMGMKDPNVEYENRLEKEKLKIKEEFEMQQQDLQKKMNDQMQFMHQMMFEQQKQMQNFSINNQQTHSNPSVNQNQPINGFQLPPAQNTLAADPLLECLNRFSVLNWLSEQQKQMVAQNIKKEAFKAGSFVFQEADPGNVFYLIESGQVEVLKKTEKNPARLVRTLQAGDHFGELALINNGVRTMGIKAKTDCVLISLQRNIFMQILSQIDNGLKKDYNQQFENMLAGERLEEQLKAMKAEKDAIERKQKELEKEQALFEIKKRDNDKQKETIISKKEEPKKLRSSSSNPQAILKDGTGNYENTSLLQESLHRKLSKKLEDIQFQDVWVTSGSRQFGKQNSNRYADGRQESAKGSNSGGMPPAGSKVVQNNPNQLKVGGPSKLSKTNLSEDNFDSKPSKLVEKPDTALTPKNEVKNHNIEAYIDFHYEKLNEQDENDLGFDDFMRQHQSLINQQDGVRHSTLLNFEQLVNTYDYLEDDQIRNQFYIDNLQNQQDSNFKWSPLQIKALIYLREHHRLYSPQNILKFNQKLLEQIKKEKSITCTKVIQQTIGMEAKQLVNFKVIINAQFAGRQDEDIEDEDDPRKYLENLASKIKIKIKAEVDKNTLNQTREVDSVTPDIELNFLELQTILYMFSDINSCDPSPALHHLIGSIPYYHIDRFQDLSDILLFKYVDIFLTEDESFDQSRSQMSRLCPYTVDFKETPSNLFLNQVKIVFLQADPNQAINGDENQIVCSQSDNLQGQASNSDWGLSMFNNNLNCQVEVFHIRDSDFKVIISPSFDLSTIMMRMSMINQNNGLQDVNSVQPENLCILPIDLKFDKPDLVKHYFKEIDCSTMKFQSGTTGISQSFQKIVGANEFYENYLKKYVEELDKILKQEFKEFFIKTAGDANNGSGDNQNQLNNHQKFFNLVINKKIVYCQIRIEDVINAGAKQFKTRMTIALKNFDSTADSHTPVYDKARHDMKFICLYSDQTTNGAVKLCEEPFTTNSHILSSMFGQEIDLGYYSLQKHYNLTQVCKIYMDTFTLLIESDDNSGSDSGLGSSDSDAFDSDSDDSDDDSDNSGKKKEKPPKEFKGKLNVFVVDTVYFQRQVKNINNQHVIMSSEILVCNQAKKILGVKFVAYDINTRHESGVFLKIDQTKWPKLENQQVEKLKFWTNFSVVPLLRDFGIKHFMDNYLTLENHRNPTFKNKMVLRLIEPRLNSQKNHADMTQELEAYQNLDAAQKQRILSQMVPDQTSISQLERFLTKEQLEQNMKN